MTSKAILLFAIIFWYLSIFSKVKGDIGKLSSIKEELEIENELKRLNKPALMTIKTQYGDVYDCVDFYKQPAFDHPLLKNHTYHHKMRPSFIPSIKNGSRKAGQQINYIGLPGGGCPVGTVPIQRTTEAAYTRSKLFRKPHPSERIRQNTFGQEYRAVTRSADERYNGGSSSITVYAPSVQGSQYSAGLLAVGNGFDSIEVGWMVSGDDQPRFYIYTTNNASSCLNTCSGFIIVNTSFPFGSVMTPVSRRGGPIREFNFFIFREETSGRWWLSIGPDYSIVGFWPPEIFDGLKDLATYVEWGGKAGTDPAYPGPPMGTGDYPGGYYLDDAYCGEISTVNLQHQVVPAKNPVAFYDKRKYFSFALEVVAVASSDSSGGPDLNIHKTCMVSDKQRSMFNKSQNFTS